MLVLSRKVGEKIMLGDNIAVVVSRIAGNRITLGIEAPDDVPIVRGELEAIVRSFNSCETGSPAPTPASRAGVASQPAFPASLGARRSVR